MKQRGRRLRQVARSVRDYLQDLLCHRFQHSDEQINRRFTGENWMPVWEQTAAVSTAAGRVLAALSQELARRRTSGDGANLPGKVGIHDRKLSAACRAGGRSLTQAEPCFLVNSSQDYNAASQAGRGLAVCLAASRLGVNASLVMSLLTPPPPAGLQTTCTPCLNLSERLRLLLFFNLRD